MYWNPVKTEREDGQCHASLVLSFPNGFKAQNERQTNKNNDDSRPQESILFSALSGLKDGVRLIVAAAAELQQFALMPHTDLRIRADQLAQTCYNPSCLDFFLSQSKSTVS